jgi:hypothetical protein
MQSPRPMDYFKQVRMGTVGHKVTLSVSDCADGNEFDPLLALVCVLDALSHHDLSGRKRVTHRRLHSAVMDVLLALAVCTVSTKLHDLHVVDCLVIDVGITVLYWRV